MLAGTGRARDELLGEMPPNYGRLTVEKAAINAVLAGCRPERHLYETVRRPYRTLLPDADHGEGTNLALQQSETRREPDAMISKFPSTEEIHVVVAGGTAGRFSVAIPGWLGTKNGSRPVTRAL